MEPQIFRKNVSNHVLNYHEMVINIIYNDCRDVDNLSHISEIGNVETGYFVIDRYTKSIFQDNLLLGLKESILHFQSALSEIRFKLAAFLLV